MERSWQMNCNIRLWLQREKRQEVGFVAESSAAIGCRLLAVVHAIILESVAADTVIIIIIILGLCYHFSPFLWRNPSLDSFH